MPRLLPLFPLELVAFPGAAVPLHIFEPRYREMVGEAETNHTEFGIVLSRDGGIIRIGCTVLVESILQRYSDGRFDVLTRGQRRFEIQSLNEEKDYLRAEVDYFADADETPAAATLRAAAMRAWRGLSREREQEQEPDERDPLLSFRIAPTIQDLELQSSLLMSRSETERLKQIIAVVPRYLERREYVDKMRRIAPANGKGHKPAEAN
jgi:Lon protease-like protein